MSSKLRKQLSNDGFEKVRTDDVEITFSAVHDIDYEAKVREIYLKFNPSKIPDIPRLMEKYKGQEENLLSQLEMKYVTRNPIKEAGAPVSYNFLNGAIIILKDGPLNLLLVATPFAFISSALNWPDLITFVFALLAIAPFAERLGFVTEQLALHTSDQIGGLLNATFGNATELIISVAALYKGLYRVVQLSLLGSILSNLLLVLGCAFLFGGMKYKTQKFDRISSQINSSILMLAAMAMLFPTVMTYANESDHLAEIGISRFSSLVLFITYCAYLYFQMITHPDASIGGGFAESTEITSSAFSSQGNDTEDDEEEEEEEDVLGVTYAIFWLTVVTVFISLLSDLLVNTIESAAKGAGIPGVFIATIIVPIVGNAAEHASAVIFARRNKLDLALGVAVGSSTQIAAMVIPLIVLVGWCSNRPMSLNFQAEEAACICLAVVLVTFALKDGSSNWLVGFILIAAYFIVAACMWGHHNDSL